MEDDQVLCSKDGHESHHDKAPLSASTTGTVTTESTQKNKLKKGGNHNNDDNLNNDSDEWTDYQKLMDVVVAQKRVKKNIKPDAMQAVQDYLLTVPFLPPPADWNATREACEAQSKSFMQARDEEWTSAQIDYLTRCLSYAADHCAKQRSSAGLVGVWYKLVESGRVPRANTLSTYLYVLTSNDSHDENNNSKQNNAHAALQVATLHDHLYGPTEKTITLRVKSLVAQEGQAAVARGLILSLDEQAQKLRTFVPLLEYYLQHAHHTADALKLVRYMWASPSVVWDDAAYGMLLAGLARHGVFAPSSAVAVNDENEDDAFFAAPGPALFHQLTSQLSKDLLEISEGTVAKLTQVLWEYHHPNYENSNGGRDQDDDIVEESHFASMQGPIQTMDRHVTMGRVTVDARTAQCPLTGTTLRLLRLNQHQRLQVRNSLLEMAHAQHEEFTQKLSQNRPERGGAYALEKLSDFVNWLEQREGPPFTAIVDGPNVAYYGHANVDFIQLSETVRQLERLGEYPLVIMPQKYVSETFWLSSLNRFQALQPEDQEILDALRAKDQLYTVPATCLDDYYWMMASVVNQQGSHDKDYEIPKPPQSPLQGRRPLLITNDQMRDHRLALLEPRAFRRWTSCHIVNYSVWCYHNTTDTTTFTTTPDNINATTTPEEVAGGPEQDDECQGTDDDTSSLRPRVYFRSASLFSREIQENPAPQLADSNATVAPTVWHFPVSEWEDPDRFCIAFSTPNNNGK